MSFMRFSKMHGAGNDFIIVDQTHSVRKFTPERIQRLCDRHKGIGADGLILLSKSSMAGQDNNCVHMDFYNCDGSRAELCGNGLRCAAAFAYQRCLAPGPDPNPCSKSTNLTMANNKSQKLRDLLSL